MHAPSPSTPHHRYRLLLGSGSARLDWSAFTAGMERLGYTGGEAVVRELYGALDADGSGVVGRREWREWMSRAASRGDAREARLFAPGGGRGLAAVAWSAASVQQMVADMLVREGLTPLDLISAFDTSKDGSLVWAE
jgi:hypothetical protein